jgi:hypothetical protein
MPTCVGMTIWKRPLRHMEHLFPGESLVSGNGGGSRVIAVENCGGADAAAESDRAACSMQQAWPEQRVQLSAEIPRRTTPAIEPQSCYLSGTI